MKVILASAFLLSASAAFAQDVYGNANGCARHGGAEVLEEDVVIFDSSSFEFLSSFCLIANETPQNESQTLLQVNCFGEGQEWPLEFVIETTDDPDRLVFFPTDTPDAREEIALCE